jgi:hypothetical protein
MDPRIVNLSTTRKQVVSFMSSPFLTRYSLNRKLGELMSRSGLFEKYRNVLHLPEIREDSSVIHPATQSLCYVLWHNLPLKQVVVGRDGKKLVVIPLIFATCLCLFIFLPFLFFCLRFVQWFIKLFFTRIPDPQAKFLYDFGLTLSGHNNGRRQNYAKRKLRPGKEEVFRWNYCDIFPFPL